MLRIKYAKLLKECGFLIPNIVSTVAEISKDDLIGEGVAIMPRATISNLRKLWSRLEWL